MQKNSRIFKDAPAVRQMAPLLIGLAGQSGSGKTASALRLARGIQRVAGGKIWGIDTEANRMLHYAPAEDENPDPSRLLFDFQHLPFVSPFGPLDYLAAIEHCARQGASIMIVDSMSHEHEGPGGVLEMHETELDRLAGNDLDKRHRVNLLAWQKPKKERRQLINGILQMPINFIFCFRAKEKTKPGKDEKGKSAMISLGWMPIAGEEFIYEMTVHCLLPPASGGVPNWAPELPGEKAMVKLPAQFKKIFTEKYKEQPLSEEIGEALAIWASGGKRLPADWHAQQAAERAANAPAPPADYAKDIPPLCAVCGDPMRFVSSQMNRGKPAFWGCPKYKDKQHQAAKKKGQKYTINAEQHHNREALLQAEEAKTKLEQRQKESAGADPPTAQEPGDDSTEPGSLPF